MTSQSPSMNRTAQQLRALDEAEHLKVTHQKVTINEIAKLSGVSKKTVSRIINKADSVSVGTREWVEAVIEAAGFSPDPVARGLAFRRSYLVGLIYDNPNAQYVVTMQTGILEQLRGSGFELLVHPCDSASASYIDDISAFVTRQKLAGVIILPPVAEDRALIQSLKNADVPFVRISARRGEMLNPPMITPQIVSLDAIGCAQAAEHLVSLGHTKIGFIGGNPNYPSAHARRSGFVEGLKRHGLEIAKHLEYGGDYSFDSGYKAGLALLGQSSRPTAIFCSNDEMSAGVYKAAYEIGLVIPRDLSVVSFDDAPLASRLTPGLSSVRLPISKMAKQAALSVTQSPRDAETHVFDSHLVVRQSTQNRLVSN